MEVIRIFIGTSANGEDREAEMVLEYGIRKYASQPVEITWMRQSHDPSSPFYGWDDSKFSTPFSAFRWAIPEICEFKGKAIYLDVDMMCQYDIADLWNTDMQDKVLLAKRYKKDNRPGPWEYSVLLIDCGKIKEYVMPISEMKRRPATQYIMYRRLGLQPWIIGELDNRWNSLDTEPFDINEAKLIHFTTLGTQPWSPSWYQHSLMDHARPELVQHWKKARQEALDSGWTPKVDYDPFGEYQFTKPREVMDSKDLEDLGMSLDEFHARWNKINLNL